MNIDDKNTQLTLLLFMLNFLLHVLHTFTSSSLSHFLSFWRDWNIYSGDNNSMVKLSATVITPGVSDFLCPSHAKR